MPKTTAHTTLTLLKMKRRWIDLKIAKAYFSVPPQLIAQKRRVEEQIALREQAQLEETA